MAAAARVVQPPPFHALRRRSWIIRCSESEEEQLPRRRRRRGPLRRGTVSRRLAVPDHIRLPPYAAAGTDRLPDVSPSRQLHDGESIAHEIDRAVHQMIIDAGAYPSPLGYGGFPKSVCTSNGDIINIDVTVYLNGYHGDTSRTYLCGEVDESTKQLVKVTEECMLKGISACKHGASFSSIGQRISEYVDEYGYSIDPFVGHGVGKIFHSEPIIWHTYDYEPGYMVAGQTFTIEPTLSLGGTQCTLWDDGWTAVTVDGSLNAQFEHTIFVTYDGAEILTMCPSVR
uniref:Methionine aminopeptidase n=1 Tax=Leersia perrieri TaxID=77586 RepID=A0A0D9X5G3_9ORYZ